MTTSPLASVPDRSNNDVAMASIKLASELARTKVRPQPAASPFRPKEFSEDVTLPGVELEDYTKRTPNDEGTHVHVVQHKEWLEKIKQPPTAAELAQRKKDNRFIATLVAGGALLFGAFVVYDSRSRRTTVPQNDQ